MNLFGEVELWDDVDQYLDGLPPKKVMVADEVTDPNLKVVLNEEGSGLFEKYV